MIWTESRSNWTNLLSLCLRFCKLSSLLDFKFWKLCGHNLKKLCGHNLTNVFLKFCIVHYQKRFGVHRERYITLNVIIDLKIEKLWGLVAKYRKLCKIQSCQACEFSILNFTESMMLFSAVLMTFPNWKVCLIEEWSIVSLNFVIAVRCTKCPK